MERNVDKIKRLNHELGRYRKKVADQNSQIEMLRKNLEATYAGNAEMQRGVDAVLAQVALSFGEKATDPDTGEDIGHRLTIPKFRVDDILSRYEIHARRDVEAEAYVLGVVSKG